MNLHIHATYPVVRLFCSYSVLAFIFPFIFNECGKNPCNRDCWLFCNMSGRFDEKLLSPVMIVVHCSERSLD